ncbi:hypothetical protein D9M71_480130 [compost metagenome]
MPNPNFCPLGKGASVFVEHEIIGGAEITLPVVLQELDLPGQLPWSYPVIITFQHGNILASASGEPVVIIPGYSQIGLSR